MSSWAIWHDEQECTDSNDIPALELHLNLWKIPNQGHKNTFSRFIDVGIKMHKCNSVSYLYVFVPFDVQRSHISDLGKPAAESIDLTNAIFNENCKSLQAHDIYFPVQVGSPNNVLNIYPLEVSDIPVEPVQETIDGAAVRVGTKIKINMPSPTKRMDNTYIRFRINPPNKDSFSSIEDNPTSILNSAFTKAEITDLRINSVRHLPRHITSELSKDSSFALKKVHFFYICSYKENYLIAHAPITSARRLESKIWDNYIKTGITSALQKSEILIAYHWKQSSVSGNNPSIQDFVAFVKTEFRFNNVYTIVKYLAVLLFISIIMSFITNRIEGLYQYMTKDDNQVQSPAANNQEAS